jgi:hypothetical protein
VGGKHQVPADLIPTYIPGTQCTGGKCQDYERMGKRDFYIVVIVVLVNQLNACTRKTLLGTKWLILSALNSQEE